MRACANKYCLRLTKKGKFSLPVVRRRRTNNLQILLYHRVNDGRDPFFSGTPVAVFDQQMELLALHYQVLPLEEAIERLKSHDLPDNAVAITFDDGYRDNYENAFPILQKYSLPATIFLATAAIGSGRTLWHDRVFSAFRETNVPMLSGIGPIRESYPLRSIAEKLHAQSRVLTFLRSLGHGERLAWIETLVAVLQVKDYQADQHLMLTWDDVRAMQRQRISFGSHTVNHPILATLSEQQVVWEIEESKQTIEREIGVPVRTFAYPNGREVDFSERTKALVREAGYDCGLSTIFGANDNSHDLFALRRGCPWEEDLPVFALKLSYYKLCE